MKLGQAKVIIRIANQDRDVEALGREIESHITRMLAQHGHKHQNTRGKHDIRVKLTKQTVADMAPHIELPSAGMVYYGRLSVLSPYGWRHPIHVLKEDEIQAIWELMQKLARKKNLVLKNHHFFTKGRFSLSGD